MSTYKLPENKVLVLRTCKPDMSSYNNFVWPVSGPVEALDFKNNKECGYGLHGWLWAVGNYGLKYKELGAKWIVVEVDKDQVIDLGDKVKFKNGNVIYCGTHRNAYDLVMKWFWLTQVTFSDKSMAKEDYECAWEHNDNLSASATGYSGHASATGKYGHASATGKYGAACVLGTFGEAKCGETGSLILTYFDGTRFRHVIGYEGENGIEKEVLYKLNEKFEIVKA